MDGGGRCFLRFLVTAGLSPGGEDVERTRERKTMPDETLQVAFEIKTACDEISRKLLRWHWERKPGAHNLNALLEHIAQREQESPSYYERMPDLSGRTSWQQLDTTLCMRVLLDPEKDASAPLDLLGNTEHPGAARRACNAVRTARNEAAHAADRTSGTQAAILFNEAVEALEEGYAGTALRTSELEQYYRMAEEFLDRCGARKPIAKASAESESASQRRKTPKSSTNRKTGGTSSSRKPRTSGTASSGRKTTQNRKTSSGNRKNGKKAKKSGANRAVLLLLLALLAIGLLIRGFGMGWK